MLSICAIFRFAQDRLHLGKIKFQTSFDLLLLSICTIFVENLTSMDEDILKKLKKDEDGLSTYEYIANNIGNCDDIMPQLIANIINVDRNGQFAVSTARYLNAIDKERYASEIDSLIKAAIEKDRERNYIPDLLGSIWGADYAEHVDELNADDNFRRIYKRVYPVGL